MLGLIGLETDELDKITEIEEKADSKGKVFDVDNNILFFNTFNSQLYCFKSKQKIDEDDVSLMRCIIPIFFKICEYKENGSRNFDYGKSKIHMTHNYEYAIQSGICKWLIGGKITV